MQHGQQNWRMPYGPSHHGGNYIPSNPLDYVAMRCRESKEELAQRVTRLERWMMRLAAAVGLLFVLAYQKDPESVGGLLSIFL